MRSVAARDEGVSPKVQNQLAVLRRLIPYLNDDDLDLDAIDGEFYRRCCETRNDLPPFISPPIGDWARLRDCMLSVVDGPVLTAEAHAYYDRFWGNSDDDWDLTSDIGPEPEIMYELPPGAEPQVAMRVFSNRWDGTDVEKRIESNVDIWGLSDQIGPAEVKPVKINVSFEFCPAGTVVPMFPRLGELKILWPHVLVVVSLPLPPRGTIAKLYNDIVVSCQEWDKRLIGKPTQQQKRVALRTWAVGLLVASGAKHLDAMREVCDLLGETEVSQPQFTEDRLRLIERVPEARPHLYKKRPRASCRDS